MRGIFDSDRGWKALLDVPDFKLAFPFCDIPRLIIMFSATVSSGEISHPSGTDLTCHLVVP